MNEQFAPSHGHFDQAARIWQAAADAVDAGGTLPRQCYTDADFLSFELETLHARSWCFAGVGSAIPDQGDAVAVEVAGQSVILVRDDGEIRALRNICPHRGVCLMEGEVRGVRAFTCPYHRWSYGLKGELRSRPHYYGGGKHDVHRDGTPSDVRLEQLRCETWNDFIFLNVSGTAMPLYDYLAPLMHTFAGYDFSQMTLCGTFDLEAPANWKLVVENYMDNYHIFAAHPSIDASFPQVKRTPARAQPPSLIYNSYEMDAERTAYMGELAANPRTGADMANRNNFLQVFPNLLLHVWPYTVMAMQLVPVAPDKTIERYFFYFYVTDGADDAERQEQAMDAYRDINQKEDFPLISAMQSARERGEFDQGKLSPFWDTMITDYAQQYVAMMRSVTNAPGTAATDNV